MQNIRIQGHKKHILKLFKGLNMIIFKCYKCGSSDVNIEKNYCNACQDNTKFTKIETED